MQTAIIKVCGPFKVIFVLRSVCSAVHVHSEGEHPLPVDSCAPDDPVPDISVIDWLRGAVGVTIGQGHCLLLRHLPRVEVHHVRDEAFHLILTWEG